MEFYGFDSRMPTKSILMIMNIEFANWMNSNCLELGLEKLVPVEIAGTIIYLNETTINKIKRIWN